jgi:hypothetical protein
MATCDVKTVYPLAWDYFQTAISDAKTAIADSDTARVTLVQTLNTAIKAQNLAISAAASVKAALMSLGLTDPQATGLMNGIPLP